jgi:predicted nucleic acid-binding protein
VSAFVLDASLAMAWCFESEATPYTEAILAQIGQGEIAWVPALWRLEVVNALLKAKRQGRVTIERAEKFLIQLREFAIESDDQSLATADTELFQLGLKHQLSSYDAAYLELAMRRKLPLATQDNNLIIAAKVKAVALFQP